MGPDGPRRAGPWSRLPDVPERPRSILHVDMDAFFAAVEIRDRPELKGKPVIVGADPRGGRGRGVVSTASYEARRFGVASAMPISEAWRRCPHGIYLPPDIDRYARESEKVMEILGRFTDLVEPVSIDEAFLDVTGSARALGSGETNGSWAVGSVKRTGTSTGGIERSPQRRRREARARRAQEKRWQARSGPVEVRFDPSIVRRQDERQNG